MNRIVMAISIICAFSSIAHADDVRPAAVKDAKYSITIAGKKPVVWDGQKQFVSEIPNVGSVMVEAHLRDTKSLLDVTVTTIKVETYTSKQGDSVQIPSSSEIMHSSCKVEVGQTCVAVGPNNEKIYSILRVE